MPSGSNGAQRALIAPLSGAAWSITRLIQYLSTEGRPPDSLVLLTTQRAQQKQIRVLLDATLKKFCPRLKAIDLKLEPLTRPKVVAKWLEQIIDALFRLRAPTVSLLITGSPPGMESILTLLSPFLPLDGVYHVILRRGQKEPHGWSWLIKNAPDSPFEPLPPEVERVLTSVFWPRETDYTVVQMPVLPYPPDVAKTAADLLSDVADKSEYRQRGLRDDYVISMIIAGLIEVSRKGEVIPTTLGRALGRAISKLVPAGERAVRR